MSDGSQKKCVYPGCLCSIPSCDCHQQHEEAERKGLRPKSDVERTNRAKACALCKHEPHATMASDYTGGTTAWLCHEGDHSCYHLWTVYGMRTMPREGVPDHQAMYLPLEHPLREELETRRV